MVALVKCKPCREGRHEDCQRGESSPPGMIKVSGCTCPFCGSTTSQVVVIDDAGDWQVVCSTQNDGCGASSPLMHTKELAIASWKRRPSKPEVDYKDKGPWCGSCGQYSGGPMACCVKMDDLPDVDAEIAKQIRARRCGQDE